MYECYAVDVMELKDFSLNRKFDVIVCGELIEHIENPGLMLDGIKTYMHENSLLIITSPNPWSSERIKLISKGHLENEWLNKEHVCWYSYQTLKQLLERKNYNEVLYDYYYGRTDKLLKIKNKFFRKYKTYKRDLKLLKKQNFDGLFFIAKLNNEKM